MTLVVAALLGFLVLSGLANFKTLLAIIAMAALYYVSLPSFVILMAIMGIIIFKTY